MRRILLVLVLCLGFVSAAAAQVFTERMNSIPDITQTDPKVKFPHGGFHYCGPAAVSNSLMWLAANGYDKLLPKKGCPTGTQAEMACLLGEKYMETRLDEGTSPAALLEGVAQFIKDCGYRYSKLQYEGWRQHPSQFDTGVVAPNLDWIKSGLLPGDSAVWLNLGWYRHDRKTDRYERLGGHWITLVGFGADKNGKEDPNSLVVHDPAKLGQSGRNEYIRVEKIAAGQIHGASGVFVNAAGFHKIADGLNLRNESDVAILDGAVVLQMLAKSI